MKIKVGGPCKERKPREETLLGSEAQVEEFIRNRLEENCHRTAWKDRVFVEVISVGEISSLFKF